MNAVIIVAKCRKTKEEFAIRCEQKNTGWHLTWAFCLNAKTIKNENYDKTNISGVIVIDNEYPGCPHCKAGGFFQCGVCKKISCCDHEAKSVKCHWCGNEAELVTVETFDNIKGGDF